MKINAKLTRKESDLLYDLICCSDIQGYYPLYMVICRRLPKYSVMMGDYIHAPVEYSTLKVDDWIKLEKLLDMSDDDQGKLLGYTTPLGVSWSLWNKIGRPVKGALSGKGISCT
tara:strand:+ start:9050 stop:9391 length:342 start_codon:yes stop_codon:yes gene_type:complete